MTILYIGGAGRSGSTLLSHILGQMPEYMAVNEVRYIFEYYVQGTFLCGCGEAISQCSFWRPILQEWQAKSRISVTDMAEWTRRWDRTRHFMRFRRVKNEDRPYVQAWGLLYRIIQKNNPNRILVDASKVPTHIRILQQAGVGPLFLLHLVRDPRAVAYSWGWRVKPETASTLPGVRMPHRHPLVALSAWIVENEAIDRMGRLIPSSRLIYERWVTEPYEELRRALHRIGIEFDPPSTDLQTVAFKPVHGIGGNPVRFSFKNEVRIKPDMRWREDMPVVWRSLLGVLSRRYRRKYGYV